MVRTGNMTQDRPILSSIEVAGDGFEPVRLPPLFLEVDSWLLAEGDGQIDVAVMPKVGRAACWFALGLGLSLAHRGFQKRLDEHSVDRFDNGDLVAVLPSREVYTFKGISQEHGLVILGLIKDRRNSTISLPVNQLSRLQHAVTETPRGRGMLVRGDLDLTPMDRVIGTRSFGNADFFDTEVIYLGNRARFQNAMSVLQIGRDMGGEHYQFTTDEVLPWGRVTTGGEVRTEGDDTGMARPLIARANSAANIIDFLKSGGSDCRCIIVDDVHVLERELHSLCRLIDDFDCRVVGFCGFRDFRQLQRIEAETGRVRARQIRPDLISRPEGNGIFESIASSAKRAVDFEWIDVFEIENDEVDLCATALSRTEELVRSGESDLDDAGLLGRAFGLLRRLANPRLDGIADENALYAIEQLEVDFARHANFWPQDAKGEFKKCLKHFRALQASPETVATSKIESIEGLLARQLTELELSNEDVGFFELDGEVLILSGWPRRAKVEERVFEYDHDTVVAVAFSFEARWFRQFNKSYRDAELYAAEKDSPYRPTRGSEKARTHWQKRPGESSVSPDIDREQFRKRLKIERDASEESSLVPASLIWFADGRICAASEGYKIPTLRSFGRFRGESNIDVRTVRGTELEHGDLCAFRSCSDDDLIRSFARTAMHVGEYDNLRELAGRWRIALQSYILGPDLWIPQLRERLRFCGLERTDMTIRNWLFGPSIIGPTNKEDLAMIAKAVGSESLQRDIDDVWNAILSIRSSHISAGNGISAMLREELVDQIEHRETLTGQYSLSFGEIEVVEVDELDTSGIEMPSSLVNRLLKPERLNV